MEQIIKKQVNTYELFIPGMVLLLCLVFMRLFTFTIQMFNIELPFRIMLALGIIFGLVFPLVIIIIGFHEGNILTSFLVSFVIFGILTPLIDSVLVGYSLITNQVIILFYLLGGIGFGIVAIGATRVHANKLQAFMIMLAGIVIILINAPNYIRVIPFVITGDTTYIAGYLDLA
jgi:hypothetical protein